MKENAFVFGNEKGTAVVVALLMLTLMTVIGIAATTSSTVEVLVAGNHKIYQVNLYRAEGAAIECAEEIESEAVDDLKDRNQQWMNVENDLPVSDHMGYEANWSSSTSSDALDDENQYLAIDKGVARGASLDMTGTGLHEYGLFGRSVKDNGNVVIEMGYRTRF